MRLTTCRFRGATHVAICRQNFQMDLLRQGEQLRDLLQGLRPEQLSSRICATVSSEEVEFLPPIPAPDKIFCVGLNYADHLSEAGSNPARPDYPSIFTRVASSLVGHRSPILAPSVSKQFDFEGELAVIIGSPAWHVRPEEALSCVAGYSCLAENSVRDFQSHSRQVTPGKNFYRSGAFGPWITTADEVPDPAALQLITRLNGVQMQSASISSLLFPIAELIAYISSFTRLLPGDVISTGTPSGVGALRDPPLWMKPGDILEIQIPTVGILENPIVDESTLSEND